MLKSSITIVIATIITYIHIIIAVFSFGVGKIAYADEQRNKLQEAADTSPNCQWGDDCIVQDLESDEDIKEARDASASAPASQLCA